MSLFSGGGKQRRDQCSLCGKSQEKVRKLIVGLHGAICSDCIDLCQGDRFVETLPEGKKSRDRCSLCGKSKNQVRRLIVGSDGALCTDCIELCLDILGNEENPPRRATPADPLIINDNVLRFPEVVLIGSEGEQHGVVESHRALEMAKSKGLDLVIISIPGPPPIAKIADFGKFRTSPGSDRPTVTSKVEAPANRSAGKGATKRVIVCGASSGIGRATAVALSESGCELVLVARRRALLEKLAAQCEKNGAKTICVPCDITQYPECEEFVRIARQDSDGVEPVLVNSAGVAEFGNFASTPVTSIDDQIRTNLLGPVYACRAFIPWVLEAGSGQIVNVLSISASHVFAGAAAYSASKAGLLMFGKSLAAEYRKQGLRLTSVLPGATDTAIWAGQDFVPRREDMLSPEAVADCIRDVILMPADRSVDEITIMPPKGIL